MLKCLEIVDYNNNFVPWEQEDMLRAWSQIDNILEVQEQEDHWINPAEWRYLASRRRVHKIGDFYFFHNGQFEQYIRGATFDLSEFHGSESDSDDDTDAKMRDGDDVDDDDAKSGDDSSDLADHPEVPVFAPLQSLYVKWSEMIVENAIDNMPQIHNLLEWLEPIQFDRIARDSWPGKVILLLCPLSKKREAKMVREHNRFVRDKSPPPPVPKQINRWKNQWERSVRVERIPWEWVDIPWNKDVYGQLESPQSIRLFYVMGIGGPANQYVYGHWLENVRSARFRRHEFCLARPFQCQSVRGKSDPQWVQDLPDIISQFRIPRSLVSRVEMPYFDLCRRFVEPFEMVPVYHKEKIAHPDFAVPLSVFVLLRIALGTDFAYNIMKV